MAKEDDGGMWIEQKAGELLGRITKSEKAMFLSAFFGGIIAHLYAYTNTIPNFDGISRMYDEQQMTISGRWFLHYASALNWYTQMPMVLGVLGMFFLALSGMIIVHLFDLKSPLLSGLWGALFVVFPAVMDTNTYIYTSSAYYLAVLIAVIAVWAVKRGKWGIPVGILLLAVSMGIYQTYVTVAIVLCMLLVMQEVMDERSEVKKIILLGVRFVLFLGLGAALYYVVLKAVLRVKGLKLLSYLGMSEVESGYPFKQLGVIGRKTYIQVGSFFFAGANGQKSALPLVVHILLLAVTLLLLALVLKERGVYRDRVKLLGFLVLLLLLPLGANFTQILSPYTEPRLIMKFSFVFFYLVPVLLINQLNENKTGKILGEIAAVVLSCGLMVTTIYDWEYDNVMYTMLNQVHRSTLSFVTNVVSRIENCENYEMGMPVVVIGGFPSDRYDSDIEVYDVVRSGSALSSSVIPLNKHIYYYMNDWLNIPVQKPEEDVFVRIAETENFKQMPLYPNDGSVQIIDGCVVVKMQETYTPMSDYEKEYENRR